MLDRTIRFLSQTHRFRLMYCGAWYSENDMLVIVVAIVESENVLSPRIDSNLNGFDYMQCLNLSLFLVFMVC